MAESITAVAQEAIKAASSFASPAKLVFIGYCILAYADKLPNPRWEFFAVASLFFVIQVVHDDYLRIWLNLRATQTRGVRGTGRS